MEPKFEDLKGKTLLTVQGMEKGSEKVILTTTDGYRYTLQHYQDCCEQVEVEDVCGDVEDIIGSPILVAEEVTSEGSCDFGHETWTFYKIDTAKGSIVLRWYGESNGYYSESVDLTVEHTPDPREVMLNGLIASEGNQ